MSLERKLQLLEKIEKAGCDCDTLYGYTCGIHALVDQLRKEFVPREPLQD